MKISAMTGAYYSKRGSKELQGAIPAIRRYRNLGFDTLDLTLTYIGRDEGEFSHDDWRERAYALKEEADRIGIKFHQAHLPFRTMKFNHADENAVALLSEATLRACEIAGICGVKWAVVHPVEKLNVPAEFIDQHTAYNQEIYGPVIELAAKYGMGIAFENVAVMAGVRPRFGCTVTDLKALCAAFPQSSVGICWDFGHANMMYGDSQVIAIRQLGDWLKATHFADNYGLRDDHLLPFVGSIKWEEILEALADIDYHGNMVPENVFLTRMPDELRDSAIRLQVEICEYINQLYSNILKERRMKE